jgi:hypothetical protein
MKGKDESGKWKKLKDLNVVHPIKTGYPTRPPVSPASDPLRGAARRHNACQPFDITLCSRLLSGLSFFVCPAAGEISTATIYERRLDFFSGGLK